MSSLTNILYKCLLTLKGKALEECPTVSAFTIESKVVSQRSVMYEEAALIVKDNSEDIWLDMMNNRRDFLKWLKVILRSFVLVADALVQTHYRIGYCWVDTGCGGR